LKTSLLSIVLKVLCGTKLQKKFKLQNKKGIFFVLQKEFTLPINVELLFSKREDGE